MKRRGLGLKLIVSRMRVRRAVKLIRKGRSIIDREERIWGLAPAGWQWRVPNTRRL